MTDLNLSQFASIPTGKAKKTGPDVTRFNQVVSLINGKGLRLSYDAAKVIAQKLGLLSLSQPTTAVFGLLNLIETPWAVCRKTGQYDPLAMAKFVNPPEGFMTRPIIQGDKAEAVLEAILAEEKAAPAPAPAPASAPTS